MNISKVKLALDQSGLEPKIEKLEKYLQLQRSKAFAPFCKAHNIHDLEIFERDNLVEAQKFVAKRNSINTLLLKISEQYC